MNRYIFLFLIAAFSLLLHAKCVAQKNIVYGAGITYTVGVPTFVPPGNSSRVAIDTVTSKWYEYATPGGWRWSGDRVQDISGCAAPAYVPGKAQSLLVLNACTEAQNGHGPELYKYTGSAWLCLNCGGNYTAGDGIDITGTEITNTAPDQVVSIAGAGINAVTGTYPNFTVTGTEVDGSTTNELQTLSVAGNNLTISDGNTVTLPSSSAAVPNGNTASRPSPTANGDLYYNTTSDQLNISDQTEWLRAGNWDFYGVVRFIPTDSTWQILDDADHTPYHISSVTSTKTTNGFTVNIAPTGGRKVGTAFFLSDESIGASGIIAGTSVGLTSVNCRVIQTSGFSIRMNNTTVISTADLHPRDITFTWDAVNLKMTIMHNSVGNGTGSGSSVNVYNCTLIPSTNANWFYARLLPGSIDRTTSQWEFYNASGTKVTPSGNWWYNRNMPWLPTNNSFNAAIGSSGNFWLFGRYAKDE